MDVALHGRCSDLSEDSEVKFAYSSNNSSVLNRCEGFKNLRVSELQQGEGSGGW